MIYCRKRSQFIFSLLAIIGVILHYNRIDSKCMYFYLILFAPIITALPILWNIKLHNEFIIIFKIKITYNSFQCIMTVALFLLCILLFYFLITGYVPEGYRAGRC